MYCDPADFKPGDQVVYDAEKYGPAEGSIPHGKVFTCVAGPSYEGSIYDTHFVDDTGFRRTVALMTRAVIYLAGPMRGYRRYNFDAFASAQDDLQSQGYVVLSPAQADLDEGFDPDVPLEEQPQFSMEGFFERDCELIRQAHIICLLPGHERSLGATAEKHIGFWLGKKVIEYDSMEELIPLRHVPSPAPGCCPPSAHKPGPPFNPDFSLDFSIEDDEDDEIGGFDERLATLGREIEELVERAYLERPDIYGDPEFDPFDGLLGSDDKPVISRPDIYTDPDTGAQKEESLCRMDLIPSDPLMQLGEVYGFGATKYDDHNWRKGYPWSKSIAALKRHLEKWIHPELPDNDPESGINHLAHVAWHCMTLMEYAASHPEKDDRWRAE